jgi:hypothetical protein
VKTFDGEIIIKKGRATHRKGLEGVGGNLFLTNQRLIFSSHFINIQTHEESIPLEEILSVETKHYDFLSAKMEFFLRNGETEVFYVPQRRQWSLEIQAEIAKMRKER